MPVYKDGTKYMVRFYRTDPLTGKRKQTKKRGFKTRREAVKWEAAEKSKATGSAPSMTFWTVFQTMLTNNDTSQSTRSKKEAWISKYCDFKDLPIDRISKPMLVAWRNELKEESGLATSTMNSGMQYVRSVLTFYSDVYGGENISSALKSFKVPKGEKKEMDIWTPEEFDLFLKYVRNPLYKTFFEFLYWTGCRRGEAVALCKEDVDVDEAKVHIRRSMKHFKNGFQPLKTDSSERVIGIDSVLLEHMKPFIDKAAPFVFGSMHSLPISQIQRNFDEAVRVSGVKRIRIHDLRHSHASLLINNGANILAVSKRLGHATVMQTLETYSHLMRETDEKMIELIENKRK